MATRNTQMPLPLVELLCSHQTPCVTQSRPGLLDTQLQASTADVSNGCDRSDEPLVLDARVDVLLPTPNDGSLRVPLP